MNITDHRYYFSVVYLVTWSIDPRDHILFAKVYGTVCLCLYRIIVNKGFKIRFRSISILTKPNKNKLKTCLKLWFSNPYVFATWCYTPLIYQSILFYQRGWQWFAPVGCKDEGIRKLEFEKFSSISILTNPRKYFFEEKKINQSLIFQRPVYVQS